MSPRISKLFILLLMLSALLLFAFSAEAADLTLMVYMSGGNLETVHGAATADIQEMTDALPEEYSYFYTCGPEPMLRAVYRMAKSSGQFSFEERMGCGFGACMGCSCKTITGYKRICREGPVLEKEEILWED